MTITESDLAWAAGLFEGEGTIRINKVTQRNLGHLVASVTNTDIEVLYFFQDRWPAHLKPVTAMRPDQKPAWAWVIAAQRAAGFIEQIKPFLRTSRVREKARFGLQFQYGKCRSHSNRTDEYREEQFNAYLWMRELNVRGTGIPCPQANDWRRR